MATSPTGNSSILRGRWLIASLTVGLLFAFLLRLGFWQLQRLAERRAANAFLLSRLELPALVLDGGDLDPVAVDLRHATVSGVFDYEGEIALRNRTWNELPGVHLIVPLRINGSDVAVLVDRGWVPYDMSDGEQRTVFDRPTGEVMVYGILHRSESRASSFSPADAPLSPDLPRLDAWHRVEIPRIQEQMPYPLLPVYVEDAVPGPASGPRFPRPAPEIELSEGPHLYYAIQWFAFSAILIVGYVLYYLKRTGRV